MAMVRPPVRVRWFLAGMGLAIGSIAGLLPQALFNRADAVACNYQAGDYGYGSIAEAFDSQPTHLGASYDESRGTYATVWVPQETTPCQRISSLYISTLGNTSGEFGWVLGRSACDGNTYTQPVAFSWTTAANGTHTCNVYPSVKPNRGNFVPFEILLVNYAARTYVAGQKVGSDHLMPINQGISIVGTERNNSADSCYAGWHELQEYHPASSWTYWDDIQVNLGDPSPCVMSTTGPHSGKDDQ